MTCLKSNEVLNNLLGYEGLKIIQRPDMFNFSLDSTLLADFVNPTKKVKKILDLGTGFAPIPLFLSLKTDAKIIGVELQEDVAEMANRNVKINQLNHQIQIMNEDIKNLKTYFAPSSFDLITCNPPFFKYKETSNVNESEYKTLARHEKAINLETIIQVANYLLNNKAHFYLVHRTERLAEVLILLKKYGFAVKRLRFIHPKEKQPSNMILLDASKQGREGLTVVPPLFVHEGLDYSDDVKRIFKYGSK